MTAEDGEELKDVVRQVHRFATQERFRYKHYYRTGDFFAWDNVSAPLMLLTHSSAACHLNADFRASRAGSSRRYIVRRQTSSASGRWTTKRRVSSIGFRSRDRLHGSCRGAIRQSGWRNTSREAMLRPPKCSRRERSVLKVLLGWRIQ